MQLTLEKTEVGVRCDKISKKEKGLHFNLFSNFNSKIHTNKSFQ